MATGTFHNALSVTDKGTINGWEYRTLSDGTTECWKVNSSSVTFSASGGAYRGSVNISFPFTFASAPFVLAASNGGQNDAWGYVTNVSPSTTGATVTLERMSAITGTATVAVYVRGIRA